MDKRGPKTAEELRRMLAEVEGEEVAPKAAEAPKPDAAPEPTPEPAGRPGFPSDEEIAAFVPLAGEVAAGLARAVKGTRYDFDTPRTVTVAGNTLTVGGLDSLTEALAPVLAKYVPGAITTPEGQLGVVLALTFGIPAGAHAGELWRQRRRERAADRLREQRTVKPAEVSA